MKSGRLSTTRTARCSVSISPNTRWSPEPAWTTSSNWARPLRRFCPRLRSFGGNLISYQDAGAPQKLVYRNWHEFGPRLGFAYRAFEGKKTFVVRGGYRISYYPQKLQDWVGSQSGSVPVGASFSNSVTNTALSPDGLPNYGLRSVPQYIAGVNTPDSIINTTDTRLLARGFNVGLLDPHHTDGRVQDWNLTFEKEILDNMVMRIGYIGNYGDKQQQEVHYNDATPDYIWYATTQSPLPTGPFANVATRPYDQQAYGNITLYAPTGYARYNGVQVELERRFSKGLGLPDLLEPREHDADQPRHG